jgi:hypothetical protein
MISSTKERELLLYLTVDSFALKIRLFRFCHTTQIQHNQSNCMKEQQTQLPPAKWKTVQNDPEPKTSQLKIYEPSPLIFFTLIYKVFLTKIIFL